MNIEQIKKKIKGKKFQDYSYSIFFFITFSFFLLFVIRPNLINVFSLHEELSHLNLLNRNYENIIRKILEIQSFIEINRNDLYVLDQSLTSSPQINKILDDITLNASESGLIINQMNISSINLKEYIKKTTKKTLTINIGAMGDFYQVNKFKKALENGRRLKVVKFLQLFKNDDESSQSANLEIKIIVDTYYL
ncbi:hypothetical protein COY87_02325 [Candidatus Roizmanbacteria bacterium CG_4_10_14_0_8_um_filter_33_9]|uniref:Type 4a pilus biogenesis protein PilO n=1 Tax=Candidatus Roizmanbacteria bacterium CG_4_10_14_0_8_um_filter_33_9 TaxID=1974826 RepID=A0A2M7QJP6_9BACT|nr:MAG: hypothetical protein COY87_02325 [Candidatus Roizmanbacteria bacterium CG_4_10_14_0_8_um_filter_33_9]